LSETYFPGFSTLVPVGTKEYVDYYARYDFGSGRGFVRFVFFFFFCVFYSGVVFADMRCF
jgi:hypothetical protein